MGKFLSYGSLLSIETALHNAAAAARQAWVEIREKATTRVRLPASE